MIHRLLALFFCIVTPIAASEKPNIILVMCDDLGWGDIQAFNPDSAIQTPHLNQMARAGLKFNRFYSAGSVCSPTRGSCLTGRHPYRYGIYNANAGHLKPEEITLPEILKDQGYTTGHFGKWHLGTLTTVVQDANRGGPRGKKHFSTPQMNGYDRCFVTESKVPTFDPMIKPKGGSQKGWDYIQDKSMAVNYGTRYWDENGNAVTDNLEGDDSKLIMDRAIPFIHNAVKSDRKFFAAIWFHAPHLPVVAGEKHVARYAKFTSYERNYYGCVSAMDDQIGRLRQALQESGVAEETMIWFCSDNGPEGESGQAPGSAGPFRGRKRSLYEGGVRVPGILEWPGHVTPGTETDLPALTSDYLPTILDLLEIELPDQRPLDGISLLPLLTEKPMQVRDSPIGFQYRNSQSWVSQQFKLITTDKGKSWELYDLIADPGEQRDISASHKELVEEMYSDLQKWVASCKKSDEEEDY